MKTAMWRAAAAAAAIAGAVTTSTASGAAEKPQLRVIGAVRTSNLALAICRELTTGQVFSLKQGDSFRGWRLSAVAIGRATFERGDETAVMEITETSGAPAALPPQVPVQAPVVSRAQVPVQAPAAPAPPAGGVPTAALPPGKWVDGDGQIIDAPRTR